MRSVKVKVYKKRVFFLQLYNFIQFLCTVPNVLLYVLLYASKKRFFPIFQHNEKYKKNKNLLNKLK